MDENRKGLLTDRECASAACHRHASYLAASGTANELPEAYCFDCLKMLTDNSVKLRPGGPITSMLWRLWDETRAHHHATACFMLAGITVQIGTVGWRSWMILTLLAAAAVADIVAMHRMTYRVWPLSVPPLLLALAVPALLGNHWVSMVALVLGLFHATLLILAWRRSFAEEYNPGPPRPGQRGPLSPGSPASGPA